MPIQPVEKIWMDGELVDWDDAKIHVLTHSLHYGCGVFEGIRAYETDRGPAVFRLTDHIVRLFNSAKIFMIDIPFTVDELVKAFSVGRVSKSPAIFDLKKLQVMNGRHLRLMSNEEFVEALVGWLGKTGYLAARGPGAEDLVRASAPLVKRKISTFADYDALAGWLFTPLEIEPEAWEVLTRDVKHSIQVIGGGLGRLEALPEFTVEAVKDALQDQLHIMGEAARDFLEPQRIAVTGRLVSTGTYESLALLGREESFARYRQTLARLAELWAAA